MRCVIATYLQVTIANEHFLQARLGDIQASAQWVQDTVALYVALCRAMRRMVEQRSLARALAISERALRAWLHMAKLPPYGELIRTIRVAHALYRMDVLGLSSAAAAHGAGLGGARSLENTVRRYTGRTPRQLIAAGGFDRYVCQIEEWFACRRRNVD